MKHFLSTAQSRNMEYWKKAHNCNIARQKGKKIQKTKISVESCSSRFTDKGIKNKQYIWDFKVSNCHEWNVELKNQHFSWQLRYECECVFFDFSHTNECNCQITDALKRLISCHSFSIMRPCFDFINNFRIMLCLMVVIKWLCDFAKYTILKFITMPQSTSVIWFWLYLAHLILNAEIVMWKTSEGIFRAAKRV